MFIPHTRLQFDSYYSKLNNINWFDTHNAAYESLLKVSVIPHTMHVAYSIDT